MGSALVDPDQAVAVDAVAAGLDALGSDGVDPFDHRDALAAIRELEVLGRRVRALQVELMDHIDRRGLHRVDGHASVKVQVRHTAHLSNGEAARRQAVMRALRDLPVVAAGYRTGEIGDDQVALLARTWANPRVRERFVAHDDAWATLAARLAYDVLAAKVAEWVRLTDEDGTLDLAERNHANRRCTHRQQPDGSWTTAIAHGSLQGAEFDTILRHFARAEYLTDWAKARLDHHEATAGQHLARTEDQRRYDAAFHLAQLAATAHADTSGGSVITTDIVIGADQYERTLTRIVTHDDPTAVPEPAALDPRSLLGSPSHRCSTLDGAPVDPTEAVLQSLLGHVRRVVVGADSVVIDLGRRSRLFRDAAALAVRLGATHCYWPGCHVPVADCQLDHLQPWNRSGRTDPGNGGPACGRHNRRKHHGYRVTRDRAGHWHTYRPDGTEIE